MQLMKNHNTIIKWITKVANGYTQLGTIQKQMHAGLREGIDFGFNKDDGNVKMVEKKEPDNYMLSEPNLSYKLF